MILVKIRLLFISSIILLSSCQRNGLEQALSASRSNKSELEKVLEHYSQNPSDSLKLKAACFLIENMLYNYHYTSSDINSYYVKCDSIFCDKNIHDKYELRLDTLLEDIDISLVKKVYDIETITANQLISNIDNAFEL